MRKMALMVLSLVMITVLTTGCATYGAKKGFPSMEGNRSTKTEVEGLVISVFPLNEKEEKEYFGSGDLSENNIVILCLEVSGLSAATVVPDIKVSSTTLEKDAIILYPLSEENVFEFLERDIGPKGFFDIPLAFTSERRYRRSIQRASIMI